MLFKELRVPHMAVRRRLGKAQDIPRDIEREWSTVLWPKRFAELKELLLRVWEAR